MLATDPQHGTHYIIVVAHVDRYYFTVARLADVMLDAARIPTVRRMSCAY